MESGRMTPPARSRAMKSRESRLASISRLALTLALIATLAAGWFAYERFIAERPAPETVVEASLAGVREQRLLIPFAARYVAVVTSRETTLGLTAQKTMILPGNVRYELNLELLSPQNLAWDADARTLTVTLPPLAISRPEYDFRDLREYSDGKLIMALTGAEDRLDNANRDAADTQIMAQARADLPMKMARTAAIHAIEQSFAMPLRAAGVDATVTAQFEEEE